MKSLLIFISAAYFIVSGHAIAADLSTYQQQLTQQVKLQQQQYQQTAQLINQQRAPLLAQLADREAKLISLRQQVLGLTRHQDDAYLSVQALEQRLSQWQQQELYIANLFGQFQQTINQSNLPATVAIEQQLTGLNALIYPTWQSGQAIATSGEIIKGLRLALGPLQLFYHAQQLSLLTGAGAEQIATTVTIANLPKEQLLLDITGGKAITVSVHEVTWYQRLQLGGFWIYPIILMGLVALMVALFKAYQVRQLAKLDCQFAQQFIHSGVLTQTQGWQAQLALFAQNKQGIGTEALADLLHQQLLAYKSKLEKGMAFIAATAAVAPLMGLLGTVSGMINTFDMMNLFGNQDASLLSGGISEALVTTELGLVVAIPALLLHAWLGRHQQGYLVQLETDAMVLSQLGERIKHA